MICSFIPSGKSFQRRPNNAGAAGMPGEWMWVRVSRCDEQKRLVFGTLDNEPLNDYDGKVELGSELAVSYSQIREHRKPTKFTNFSASAYERTRSNPAQRSLSSRGIDFQLRLRTQGHFTEWLIISVPAMLAGHPLRGWILYTPHAERVGQQNNVLFAAFRTV